MTVKKAVRRKVKRAAAKPKATKKVAKKKAVRKARVAKGPKKPGKWAEPAADSTTGDSAGATRGRKAKRPSSDQKMLPVMADARNLALDAEIETWQKKTVAKNNAGAAIKKSLVAIGKLLRDDSLQSYAHNGDKFTLIPGEDVVKHQTVKNE